MYRPWWLRLRTACLLGDPGIGVSPTTTHIPAPQNLLSAQVGGDRAEVALCGSSFVAVLFKLSMAEWDHVNTKWSRTAVTTSSLKAQDTGVGVGEWGGWS